MIRYGNFLFRYRNTFFPLVLCALLLSFKPPEIGALLDTTLDILGVLVVLTGQAVRALVIGLDYIKRGGLHKKVYADELVTSGIFKHCRNPLYLGNLLIIAGLLIVHDNPWSYLFGVIFFVLSYMSIVKAEEKYLAEKFGAAYSDYCERTPRLLFRLHGLRQTLSGRNFNWSKVIFKDYSTMMTWIISLCVLFSWDDISLHGIRSAAVTIAVSAGFVLLAVCSGVYIKTLKKAGVGRLA